MAEKTNKDWYPYKDFGGYFKLENGALMQCPMNADGTPNDSEPCEVDWYEALDYDIDLSEIIQELKKRP